MGEPADYELVSGLVAADCSVPPRSAERLEPICVSLDGSDLAWERVCGSGTVALAIAPGRPLSGPCDTGEVSDAGRGVAADVGTSHWEDLRAVDRAHDLPAACRDTCS